MIETFSNIPSQFLETFQRKNIHAFWVYFDFKILCLRRWWVVDCVSPLFTLLILVLLYSIIKFRSASQCLSTTFRTFSSLCVRSFICSITFIILRTWRSDQQGWQWRFLHLGHWPRGTKHRSWPWWHLPYNSRTWPTPTPLWTWTSQQPRKPWKKH